MRSRVALIVTATAILLAGLVATLVLLVDAQRRTGAQIDAFARAGVGCTTTMRIERAGEYFVFAELGAEPVERVGCAPVADPGARFSVDVAGAEGVRVATDDRSITYSRGVVSAGSVQRLTADGPAEVVVTVVGSDPGVVAALGPDPYAGVDDRRALALIIGAATLLVGGTLFLVGARADEAAGDDTAAAPTVWAPPRPERRLS